VPRRSGAFKKRRTIANGGRGGEAVAKLESLAHVGIFVTDWAAALRFYTREIGLKVRDEDRKWDYVALGSRKAGTDASLNLWQPIPAWGGTEYEAGMKQIGTVTGITFRTSSLDKTAELFERRGVKVEVRGEGASGSVASPTRMATRSSWWSPRNPGRPGLGSSPWSW